VSRTIENARKFASMFIKRNYKTHETTLTPSKTQTRTNNNYVSHTASQNNHHPHQYLNHNPNLWQFSNTNTKDTENNRMHYYRFFQLIRDNTKQQSLDFI
jgi:hypothetical protein